MYYFLYYKCERIDRYPSHNESSTSYNQTITSKHPLQWQLDCNEEFNKPIPENPDYPSKTLQEYYEVMYWNELTKKEYRKFKGHIG